MNTGALLGVATNNWDLQKKNLVNVQNIVIGQVAPPIGLGTWTGFTSPPAINSVNAGSVTWDAPRLVSTGLYSHVLSPAAKIFGCWVLNDTITFTGNGLTGLEVGGLYVRPQITCSDGQGANEVAVGQDIVLTVRGTNTLSQLIAFNPNILAMANATSAYVVRANIQLPDNAGVTVGTTTLFQGSVSLGSTNTMTNIVGLDLLTLSSGVGSTIWALAIGNYNSYFKGNTTFGANTTPTYPVDVTGTARVTNSSTTVAGVISSMSGTPAASTTLAAFSDTSSVPIGSNASAVYSSFNGAPTLTGTGTAAYYGISMGATCTGAYSGNPIGINGQFTNGGTGTIPTGTGVSGAYLSTNGSATTTLAYAFKGSIAATGGTITKGIGFGISGLTFGGTITTFVALDIGVATALAGTTIWAMQVGNYQSYHQGKIAFGGTSAPANSVDIQGGALNYNVDTFSYTAGGTTTLDITKGNVHKTTTATGNTTISASAGTVAGEVIHVMITNDATAARTITWGSNFKSTGNLVGTQSKTAVVSFVSDGTNYYEFARTTGL